MLAPAPQHSRVTRGTATSALRAISALLAKRLAGLQPSAAFNRLSISARLILLVLGLALPLNLVIVGVIWDLVQRANEVQRTSLLYAARSIAAGVDAELGKYMALAEALSRSPALLDDNLDAFEAEARRAFPAGGDAWVLVADVNGQQLINTLAQPGEPLPRRNPLAIEAQQRAFATGSIVISDVLQRSRQRRIGLPISKSQSSRTVSPFAGWPLALEAANSSPSSVRVTSPGTGLSASSMAKAASSRACRKERPRLANLPLKGGARSKIKLVCSSIHPLRAMRS